MTPEQAAALRAPFPPEQIGKLPKGGIKLDYVSHAWVTDRLLEVDPAWHWRPLAIDAYGSPVIDDRGGLWIELQVCGVGRIGYGTGTGPEAVKIAIGDAIRNAAMRFGVALDLWEKETPPWEQDDATHIKPTKTKQKATDTDKWQAPPEPPSPVEDLSPPGVGSPPPTQVGHPPSPPVSGATPITQGQVKLVNVLAAGAGITDRALLHEGITKLVGREVNSVKHLTKAEATTVIESLQGRQP